MIYSTKNFAILVLFFSIHFNTPLHLNRSLHSESYSSHRLDDHLYRNGGGKIPRPQSRLTANEVEELKNDVLEAKPLIKENETLEDKPLIKENETLEDKPLIKENETLEDKPLIKENPALEKKQRADKNFGFWKYNLYSQSRFRSIRANPKEDRESRYEGYASLEPELQWSYSNGGSLRPFIILSPKMGGVEEQLIQKTKTTIYDFEAMAGFHFNLLGENSYLQFGRGFHRLDTYGFVFAERMNSVDLGSRLILNSLTLGVSAITGNFSSDNLTLTPSDWKTNRQSILGGAFFIEYKERVNAHIQIYGYQMISPKILPEAKKNLERGEDSKYIGMDSKFLVKDIGIYFELGGTNQQTKEDFYLSNLYQSETNSYQNLFSSYGKIGWIWENWTLESAVLIQSKEGYRSITGTPRFMGGASSILLGWNQLGERMKFEKRGMEMGGLYLDKKWNFESSSGWHTSLYANTANLEFGRGYEGILHATKLGIAGIFDPSSFILGSVAYAKILPREKIRPLLDENSEKDEAKEYLKFYLSAGFNF